MKYELISALFFVCASATVIPYQPAGDLVNSNPATNWQNLPTYDVLQIPQADAGKIDEKKEALVVTPEILKQVKRDTPKESDSFIKKFYQSIKSVKL